MQTVLITGGGGLVGSRIIELLSHEFNFLSPSSKELDITDYKKTEAYLKEHDYDFLLHLAAYTNVDQAEKEKELCRLINVTGTENLWKTTQQIGKKFILVSTDFVFGGEKGQYHEASPPAPRGFYGQTKYEAEQIVKEQAMIVRLSYPYRANFPRKKDFMRAILTLLQNGQTIRGITDSLITPTFIDDIAPSLRILINNYKREIYHLVGADSLSPYETFRLIAREFKLDPDLVKPISFETYFANKAPRPQYSEIINTHPEFFFHTFAEGLNLVKETSA